MHWVTSHQLAIACRAARDGSGKQGDRRELESWTGEAAGHVFGTREKLLFSLFDTRKKEGPTFPLICCKECKTCSPAASPVMICLSRSHKSTTPDSEHRKTTTKISQTFPTKRIKLVPLFSPQNSNARSVTCCAVGGKAVVTPVVHARLCGGSLHAVLPDGLRVFQKKGMEETEKVFVRKLFTFSQVNENIKERETAVMQLHFPVAFRQTKNDLLQDSEGESGEGCLLPFLLFFGRKRILLPSYTTLSLPSAISLPSASSLSLFAEDCVCLPRVCLKRAKRSPRSPKKCRIRFRCRLIQSVTAIISLKQVTTRD